MPYQRHGPWTSQEDDHLRHLVQTRGADHWIQIQNLIATRTAKQCRERWHNNLRPDLVHTPITEAEGRQIEYWYGKLGTKWATIARHLPGRSENAVKNWWNGGVNKRKRAARAGHLHHRAPGYPAPPQLPLPSFPSIPPLGDRRANVMELPLPTNIQHPLPPVVHSSARYSPPMQSSYDYRPPPMELPNLYSHHDRPVPVLPSTRHSPSAVSSYSAGTPCLTADNGGPSAAPSPITPVGPAPLVGHWDHHSRFNAASVQPFGCGMPRIGGHTLSSHDPIVYRAGDSPPRGSSHTQSSSRSSMMDIHSIIQK